MATTDFGDLDASALAALVRSKQVSALELVDDAIRRCAQVNGQLNAVITETFERARSEARGPLGAGPFAGVPFLMKDFGAEVAGVRFCEGSGFLHDYVPSVDSEIYTRFRRAGGAGHSTTGSGAVYRFDNADQGP